MKSSRRGYSVSLLLLLLAGSGVATRVMMQRRAEQEKPASERQTATDSSSASSSAIARAKTRRAHDKEQGEEERLETVERWFTQVEIFPPEMMGSLREVIGGLTLEATRKILIAHDISSQRGIARFPLHQEILALLAEHFGKLAPQEVAAILFPDPAQGRPPYPRADAMLAGIAQVDPALAFQIWYGPTHPADGGEACLAATGIGDDVLREVVRLWTSADAAAATAALHQVSDRERADLYPGLVAGLPAGSDWVAETGRFETLFPAPAGATVSWAGAADSLVARWAASDPDAAFGWLQQRPEIQQTPGDGYAAVSGWLAAEPGRAVAWLERNTPTGMERGALLTGLIVTETEGDARAAKMALSLISEDATRDAAVLKALKQETQHVEVLRVWEASPLLSPEVVAKVSAAIQEELRPKPPPGYNNRRPFHFDYQLPTP